MDKMIEFLSYDKKQMKEYLENYEKKDIASLRKMLCQLKKEQDTLIDEKHHLQRKKDTNELSSLREKIRKSKIFKDLMMERINTLSIDEVKRERKKHLPVFLKMEASSMRDLDSLSIFLGEDEIAKLKELDRETDSYKKLSLLEEFISCYEEVYTHTKEELEQLYLYLADFLAIPKNRAMKKMIHGIIQEEDYTIWRNKINHLRTFITTLNRVLERLYTLRGICKATIEKQHKDLNKPYKDIFDEDTLQIILKLVDSTLYQNNEFIENLHNILNKDIFYAFDEVYRSIEVVTEDILTSFQPNEKGEMSKETVICLCNVMKNLLISKVNEIKRYVTKEDSYIYTEQLNKIVKKYEKVKKEAIEKEQKPKKEPYLDILLHFLENPKNYYYIERILEVVVPKMEESDIEIFVENVIDSFIKNYKWKIANQRLPYIEPKYYYHILKYILDNKYVAQTIKEKGKQRLNTWNDSLCAKKETAIRNEALMDIENLKRHVSIEPKGDETITADIQKAVLERVHYLEGKQKQKNSEYPTKTFAVGKYAYSIEYNDEGDLYFRIHLLDGSSFIFENDILDEKIKKHMLLSEKVPFHLPYLEGGNYPALTFQYHIYKNGKYRFQFFEDLIQIDKVYKESEMEHYREITDLKELVSSYKRLHKKGNMDTLATYTESIVSNEILSIFAACPKDIPCMYKRPLTQLIEKTQIENHNQICHLLAKMDKKTAHQIFAILEETREDIYCNYRTEDAYLVLEPFRYETIYLYRTLKRILTKNYDFNEQYDANKKEVEMYCKALNEQRGYVSELFFERKEQKVKKN